MSIILKLHNANLLDPNPEFKKHSIYECIMGSFSYGVSNQTSDMDIYSVCVPDMDILFPHTAGHIMGFGPQPVKFETYQKHHIDYDQKQYDINIFSIIKFFDLCADNNPNALDALFVPERCVTHIESAGKIMRENRKLFLHKGSFHRFKGYAYAQFKKLEHKTPTGNRKHLIDQFGVDTKYMYHIFRLAEECEQILVEHDIDLEKSKELLKSVRAGEYSLERAKQWFDAKEMILNDLYIKSTLQHKPDYTKLKQVLLACIEDVHGSISSYINISADLTTIKKYNEIIKIINGN